MGQAINSQCVARMCHILCIISFGESFYCYNFIYCIVYYYYIVKSYNPCSVTNVEKCYGYISIHLPFVKTQEPCLPLKYVAMWVAFIFSVAVLQPWAPLSGMTMQTHGPVIRCTESTCPTAQAWLTISIWHLHSPVSCSDSPKHGLQNA